MTSPDRIAIEDHRTSDEPPVSVRRSRPDDRPLLVDVWLRSVRASHTFLTPAQIDGLIEPARGYLVSDEAELWVVADAADLPVGFMGLASNEVESLFLAPEVHRRGLGRRLIEHAAALRGALIVVVNEQNVAAVRFYEACGFVVERRSEVDDAGRPFPILHMRRPVHTRRPAENEVRLRQS